MADAPTQEQPRLLKDDHLLDRVHIGAMIAHAVVLCAVLLTLVVDDRHHDRLAFLASLGTAGVFIMQLVLRRIAVSIRSRQREQFRHTRDSREQIQELFAMTDMLQAAETYEDAGAVLMATARRLLPGYGAALFVFNNSRDRLDLARAWDMPEGFDAPEMLSPSNCWALKRGKPHINSPGEASLCCAHHASQVASVELPMMACGQLHGLLVIAHPERDGALQRLLDIRKAGPGTG